MGNKEPNDIGNFTRIPNDLLDFYVPAMGPHGLSVYVIIKEHEFDKNKDSCFPSLQTIADRLNIKRQTVIKYIKKLEKLILINVKRSKKNNKSNFSNHYKTLPVQIPIPEDVLKENYPKKLIPKYQEKIKERLRKTDLLAQSKLNTTQSISNTRVVNDFDSNKTNDNQTKINKTNLNINKDVINQEFFESLFNLFELRFPALNRTQFGRLWKNALSKKNNNPKTAKIFLEEILKASKDYVIGNPIGWIKSGIENNYDSEPKPKEYWVQLNKDRQNMLNNAQIKKTSFDAFKQAKNSDVVVKRADLDYETEDDELEAIENEMLKKLESESELDVEKDEILEEVG
jgi:hypothetical protein